MLSKASGKSDHKVITVIASEITLAGRDHSCFPRIDAALKTLARAYAGFHAAVRAPLAAAASVYLP
jgi:hypothetical protein